MRESALMHNSLSELFALRRLLAHMPSICRGPQDKRMGGGVQAHPGVHARMLRDGWDKRPGVRVVFGRWCGHDKRHMALSCETPSRQSAWLC